MFVLSFTRILYEIKFKIETSPKPTIFRQTQVNTVSQRIIKKYIWSEISEMQENNF